MDDFELFEQLAGDDNDVDEYGMDPMTKKRLKVGKLMQRKKVKPRKPVSTNLPYSLARVPNLSHGEEREMSKLRDRKYLGERQKVEPAVAFPGEDSKVRQGSFKVSSKMLDVFKKEYGYKPDDMLFKNQREIIAKIPREELATVWGAENIPDAQDVIARNPKQAFRMWLKNIGKVEPRLARAIRKNPDNAALWFYATIMSMSGRDMADIILKQYFMSEPSQSWRGKMKKEDDESDLRSREYLGEERTYASDRQKKAAIQVQNFLNWIEDQIGYAKKAFGKWQSDDRFEPQLVNVDQMLTEIQSRARITQRKLTLLK